MGMTRQEAELITELSETMAKGLKEVAETLLERIKVLEADVAALKREPFKPFRQKLKERNT